MMCVSHTEDVGEGQDDAGQTERVTVILRFKCPPQRDSLGSSAQLSSHSDH